MSEENTENMQTEEKSPRLQKQTSVSPEALESGEVIFRLKSATDEERNAFEQAVREARENKHALIVNDEFVDVVDASQRDVRVEIEKDEPVVEAKTEEKEEPKEEVKEEPKTEETTQQQAPPTPQPQAPPQPQWYGPQNYTQQQYYPQNGPTPQQTGAPMPPPQNDDPTPPGQRRWEYDPHTGRRLGPQPDNVQQRGYNQYGWYQAPQQPNQAERVDQNRQQ